MEGKGEIKTYTKHLCTHKPYHDHEVMTRKLKCCWLCDRDFEPVNTESSSVYLF
jgi:hypothetical protein